MTLSLKNRVYLNIKNIVPKGLETIFQIRDYALVPDYKFKDLDCDLIQRLEESRIISRPFKISKKYIH